ncbi:hypothetical protein BCU70_05825 [Vibrio sp. 10N.286.49.C2]|uniref:glycosyltransferase family 4 protein n=1 Tax=unclassified Vibrio TaxID=2614977 RepID=UPI000C8149E2|nr:MULTISPECIES: glycosyltransferase [unclassified Vibrio]PMH31422.1 hypothetical protein BCU70_05825 [Vibrio sp. 10N.286.49.C2]PMH50443.1 hypothetical protein BCU66_18185 [Vibrio sp. 10N.286.49.B1]PMH78074.1 hypothetical protein BCU58_11130 [Vibrio sp. 10N.286.48.B7]
MLNQNTLSRHIVVFDPMPFHGGSKVATQSILSLCDEPNMTVSVITAHPKGWENTGLQGHIPVNILSIPFASVVSKLKGRAFYLLLAYRLFWCLIYLAWLPKVSLLVGSTQPGSDMPLYFLKRWFGYPVLQFIHGPVGNSRSVAWCLKNADKIYYLDSAVESILIALNLSPQPSQHSDFAATAATKPLTLEDINASRFINGLSVAQWPRLRNQSRARVFWAASLLKWKNLDLLTEALSRQTQPISGDVCYIRPSKMVALQDQCVAPQNTPRITWHQQPNNLDEIRMNSSIFVSTSVNEPFGLSILEAMAAGLCPVIPHDGAYWDNQLTDGVNCIKYTANDASSLASKLQFIAQHHLARENISIAALEYAQHYQADNVYRDILTSIMSLSKPAMLHEASNE